ncbi:LysR family transcriptional regulator [Novosphingobium decolorationis]|uniref:LysR family transcriptional regulator n=1 Tax=Novosphingobium decolorationis TaxID=2698673 RepID=A0ABX8E941_9SPHN|nr:LysR family transcriptional regulator [Novosphingobium decolorationis]QVM85373.1 LysR family transcriptional regulator [Novosphingobium decolorationis]
MNWDDIRTFLAIARARSLSGAARELGLSQSTMSRRLVALEERSGARLLLKTPHGYELTPLGESVLANAQRMDEDAMALERVVQGRDVALSGLVRLTTVETLANRLIPIAAAKLREDYPGISIDLLSDTRSLSLIEREADIAIRMVRFEHNELISRRMGTMVCALYASPDYLAAHPEPLTDPGHRLITVMPDMAHQAEARWLLEKAPEAQVVYRSNSRDAQAGAVHEGLGIACLPQYLAETMPGVVRLKDAGLGPAREIWLGVHRDLRDMPRIRAVIDALDAAFKAERLRFLVA